MMDRRAFLIDLGVTTALGLTLPQSLLIRADEITR